MIDIIIICSIIVLAFALFVTERLRIDLIALLILCTLLVVGFFRDTFPSTLEVVSGFSNPATIIVAAMFILSAALTRTGAISWITSSITHLARGKEILMFLFLALNVGFVSAFINNTAAVAVFLPIALSLAQQYRLSPSKLMIPLSYASIFGGTCTLIGTSTNILVSSIAENHGIGAISMFELTKLGIIFFIVGLIYLFFIGWKILPQRVGAGSLTRKYQIRNYLTEIFIDSKSALIDKSVVDAKISERFDINVLGIIRDRQRIWAGIKNTRLRTGDILLVHGSLENFLKMRDTLNVSMLQDVKLDDKELSSEEVTMVEAVISPSSSLIGKSLKEAAFRNRYNAFVLAVRTHGTTIVKKVGHIRLSAGDTLLLQGRTASIEALADAPDFIFLQDIHVPRLRKEKALFAIGIMAFVVTSAALGLMPILASAILGSLFVVLSGCITLREAYESIDWMVIFLLAGMIPLGIAMEKTGTALFLAQSLIEMIGFFGPVGVVSIFYLLVSVLTQVMSNNASAIVLTPIAISISSQLELSPWPFIMAVAFAASAAFVTPFGYQTNLMVYGPGGYKFTDYLKIGIPLNILFWIVATICIPIFWPFK